jgi:hypothetical protein
MHPRPASSAPGVQKKAPQKMRGYQSLAGQNILDHKPPKFPKNKPIKHLGSKIVF